MNTIVIFVKAPVAGKVKTRLCPPLSHEQAAALYRAFVRDTLAAARKVARARLEIAYQPAAAYPDLRWLGPDADTPYFVQKGAGLGKKLVHAFEQAFRSGARKAVVLGSDTPHIEPAAVREAFRLLEGHDAVLGPAADGGYYLVGLKRPIPALFAGVSWSTPRVLRQTLDRAQRCGLSYRLLPECRDIDTFADLESLMRPSHGSRSVPPFTCRALGCSIPALAATYS